MMTDPSPDLRLRDRLVVLTGGSGFFGTHLAQELLQRGARLRIASRHPEKAFRVKALANLGQVQFARCDVTDSASLSRAMQGSQAAVNLVGAFAGNLDALQGAGAGRIAAAARDAGAQAFVQISAIGADAAGATAYARTKAAGERAVLAAFPTATILRPSVLFGADDAFLNMFGQLIARLPALPVFGPGAKLQPLFVDDAALAAANALADPARHGGKTYEIGGPEVVTMLDLNRRIAAAQERRRGFFELPDFVSEAIATFTGWLPFAPLSRDQWKLLQAGSVAANGIGDLTTLGVAPRPLGLFVDRWMIRYRSQGRFNDRLAV